MYNDYDMPALLDPNDLPDIDPVTGAPAPRSRRTSFTHNPRRSSGSYVGVPIPVPVPAGGFVPASPYVFVGVLSLLFPIPLKI
jgi:hypothetical protein